MDENNEEIINWQDGPSNAAYIDFTNYNSWDWYLRQLKSLKNLIGPGGINFDAGETDWGRGVSRH